MEIVNKQQPSGSNSQWPMAVSEEPSTTCQRYHASDIASGVLSYYSLKESLARASERLELVARKKYLRDSAYESNWMSSNIFALSPSPGGNSESMPSTLSEVTDEYGYDNADALIAQIIAHENVVTRLSNLLEALQADILGSRPSHLKDGLAKLKFVHFLLQDGAEIENAKLIQLIEESGSFLESVAPQCGPPCRGQGTVVST